MVLWHFVILTRERCSNPGFSQGDALKVVLPGIPQPAMDLPSFEPEHFCLFSAWKEATHMVVVRVVIQVEVIGSLLQSLLASCLLRFSNL